jgi:hypothetical protein
MQSTSRIALILTTMLAAGCAKESPPPATPSTPLVEQRAADPVQKDVEEIHGSFAPGGIAATYRARFNEGKIQSLQETRKASSQTATYEFLGARLMKYRGPALNSNDMLELEFDEQGRMLKAKAGDKDASLEDITAIRDRAQSLRSHAVSQYGVKAHDQG